MSSKSFLFNMLPIESNVYISGEESYDCDPNLPYPWFTFKFRVIHRIQSVDATRVDDDDIKIHNSFHKFYHQFDKLLANLDESKAVVAGMLSDIQIPFSIDGKNYHDEDGCLNYWKDPYSRRTLIPLDDLDDIVMRILKRVFRASYERADLIITIDKHTVVLQEECNNNNNNNNNVEHQANYNDYGYDYDFEDKCWAVEDSLLNSLDRQKGGCSYAKSLQTMQLATTSRRRERNYL